MNETPMAAEQTTPYPPRFRWLRRFCVAGVVTIGVLLVVRLAWGHAMQHRVDAARAAIIARGAPVEPDDLNPAAALPASTNAATYLTKATTLLTGVWSPAESQLVYAEYPPYPPRWHRLADAAWTANQPAFAQARAARPYAEVDWGVRHSCPMLTTLTATFMPLSQYRSLANQLGDAGLRAHVHGNDAAAIEFIRDARHLARSVGQQSLLIQHLVEIGIEALAINRLMVIAPAIEVVDGKDIPLGAAAPDGAATRGQIEALIAELLNDPEPGRAGAAALDAEFVSVRDTLRLVTRRNWVVTPAIDAAEAALAAGFEHFAAAAMQPNFQAARAAAPEAFDGPGVYPAKDAISAIANQITFRSGRVIRQEMRILAERRMAAVSLAVRLFRIDENRWPRTLDELVPRYLPAVPSDPFRADGGPLSYFIAINPSDGGERPLVYDVSEDGVDDTSAGGATTRPPLLPDEPYGWHVPQTSPRRESPDQWRDLSRYVPPPPPAGAPGEADNMEDGWDDDTDASEAPDDYPDESDDPRQDEERDTGAGDPP